MIYSAGWWEGVAAGRRAGADDRTAGAGTAGRRVAKRVRTT
ncbi:hypothetical protein [Mesorhizobium sp. M2C.T.Ca.TU.002.02.1.1]|nr:hypothetical protein [Mesorhizobium sp. M2C.T.Ca.TU.002.02.1.1]